MTEENESGRQPNIVAKVGGLVDETHVTLGIHGSDLRPEEISDVLGCTPTHAHRKGDRRGPRSSPWRAGAWLLTVEGTAPAGPDELLQRLAVLGGDVGFDIYVAPEVPEAAERFYRTMDEIVERQVSAAREEPGKDHRPTH